MKRFYVPTENEQTWRQFLQEPDRQWVRGYSAFELASCWEKAAGFPGEVDAALAASTIPALQELELLLGIPEHPVALPPAGGRPSMTDLWVLARSRRTDDLVSIAVEGKVSESFGPIVHEWFTNPSPGKQQRLDFLCAKLGVTRTDVQDLRYQLLHRTVSAVLEAERFGTRTALMLVHSFSKTQESFDDYAAFAHLLGANPVNGSVSRAPRTQGLDLYLGWVTG